MINKSSFEFYNELPGGFSGRPVNISGNMRGSCKVFVAERRGADPVQVYVVEYDCGYNFRSEAVADDGLLAVGHNAFIFLYDLVGGKNLLTFQLAGYFSGLYWHEGLLFVADAGSLLCVDREGGILWRHTGLGIDGVIIEEFRGSKIYGSGEWDPPGGWQDFVLDIRTGKTLAEDVGD
jgi:hypothetical protein